MIYHINVLIEAPIGVFMDILRRISAEEAQFFLVDGSLRGPVFEEKIKIDSGFLYDSLGIEYFSPSKIFWRRIKASAKKHNCDKIITDHYLALLGDKRTCIEGTVKYYASLAN